MFSNMLGKKAPEFPRFKWLNTDKPLSLSKLRGNIIILDFWTYCCINCMHMLHTLEYIEDKYKGKPVIVIGVHSAKFYNEQVVENIEHAIDRYEIKHPVIVDEGMRIWQDYNVNAWPTIVIIDPKGNIVYKQAGEGQREYIEDVVDILLDRYKDTLAEPIKLKPKVKSSKVLAYPSKLAIDKDNSLLAISDSNNNRILILSLKDNKVKKAIGGKKGFKDGSADDARFYRPQGLVFVDDKLYVADTENHAIRVIDLNDYHVNTVAGNGKQGFMINADDPREVSLNSPWDLAYNSNKLYIAMAGLHQIWYYDIASNKVSIFAGSGYEGLLDSNLADAQFAQPSGLSIHDNKLYIADSESSAIRYIDLNDLIVKTIVGKDLFIFGYRDGKLEQALLQHPIGLHADKDEIYVADTYNHAIRLISIKDNAINTIIGKDRKGLCRFDDPSCDTLALYEPNDVKAYDGKLYIADTNNHLIRVYDLEKNILNTLRITF